MKAKLKRNVRRAINLQRRARYAANTRLSVARNYAFSVDSPRQKMQNEKKLSVEGWIIPKKPGKFELRVRNNDTIHPLKTGLKRLDVVKAHPDLPKDKALYSGFKAEFEFEDGEVSLEINSGKGYKKLYSTPVQFGLENLPEAIYNKDLSNNYPEHVNLIENRQQFYYEGQLDAGYERHQNDPRLTAIYLPQFHPFKENDLAWGKGFTEWSNVTTGQPRFIGHQQPILPKDLGFYDLRLESKILEQIDLAKQYGISGFCFYYYWFSGRKLMEGPLKTFMAHKEWDFNFTICWANENWTKRWDGRDDDIIIAQEYLDEDPLNFIKDVETILTDDRYICEEGKPVLMVYRASELKNPAHYAEVWRRYFRDKYKKELQLVSFLSFDDQDPREYGFDAALDFAPLSAFFKNRLFKDSKFPYIDVRQKLLDVNFSGVVADYRSIALNDELGRAYDFPTYQCLTPSWDNDARKKGKGFVYQNFSPDLYAHWLRRLIAQEKQKTKAPLIFINAWNEWAEGAILEPSMHLGHATLNRTVETMAAESFNKHNAASFPAYAVKRAPQTKLAVVVHLYYTDLWPVIKSRLNNIKQPYDLFVTLNVRDKDFKPSVDSQQTKLHTYILPNRGRDVLPFLYVAQRIKAAGYDYVLKLHSKKSKHRADGSSWFEEMVQNLLPSPEIVQSVLNCLEDPKTGLIGPANHLVSLKRHMGSNASILKHLISRAYSKESAAAVLKQPERYPYFGGTMFWARLDTLDSVLGLYLMPDDFQSEHGQVDGTTAHALERLFGIVCRLDDRNLYELDGHGLAAVTAEELVTKYKFAP